MKKLIPLLALGLVLTALPVIETGCGSHTVTLAQGGAYSDAYLATTDQAILDANSALTDFVSWYQANQVFLDAKAPQVAQYVASVNAHRSEWIRSAYAARDAYYNAAQAYKSALAAGTAGAAPPTNAGVAAALSILKDATTQIAQYKALHP